MQVVDLFFGRIVPERGDVTEPEWRSFLDDTVTANLPGGYTVQEGYGIWVNPATGGAVREASFIIRVLLPDTSDNLAAVNRIRAEYQRRFRQLVVGMIITPACGTF